MSFESALAFTLRWEGWSALTNDPHDPGGITKFGISDARDGQRDGKTDVDGDQLPDTLIADLTAADAAAIYERDYWRASGAHALAEPLATVVFDTAVNLGPGRARYFLKVSHGDPLEYLALRDKWYRYRALKVPQLARYLHGWLNRDEALRGVVLKAKTPAASASPSKDPKALP